MHTRGTLKQLLRRELKNHLLVVVSNRQPYIHVHRRGRIACLRPASGMALALDPVMQATGGVWIAHGSGSADRETADAQGRLRVPPRRPAYTLERVWLTRAQEEGYYYGFANSALWPLCHIAYRRPVFDEAHWRAYCEVNALFAAAVARTVGTRPAVVFIQDYHFALLPQLVKQACPQALVAQFWHIPWPNPEVFRICPWKDEILQGLLGNDILGFHIRYHAINFLDTVDRALEVRCDRELTAVIHGGRITRVRAFPISVDFAGIARAAASRETQRWRTLFERRYRLASRPLLLGVDRLDYTKGIPERLRALDRFLERYPRYRGRFQFLQVGVPSRSHILEYKQHERAVHRLVTDINRRHRTDNWVPVILVRENLPSPALYALYRLARACIVSSLHDGMNLVAKEFVAANLEEDGLLLLSQFTGSARELRQAVILNPFATDEFAEKIRFALEMDGEEVRRRMHRLRADVSENNIYKWATQLLRKLGKYA